MTSTYRFLLVLCLLLCARDGYGQSQPVPAASEDVKDLAKKTQNPVGDIISVPFQFNFNSGGGLRDETLFNLNFQPVIPIHVTSGLSIISRTIVPIFSIPGPPSTRFSGIG